MAAAITFIWLIIGFYIARFYYCYFTRPNPLPGPFSLPLLVIRNSNYLDKLDIFKPLDKTKYFKRNFSGSLKFNTSSSFIFNNDYHKWRRNRQFLTKILMSKKFQYGFIYSIQEIFKRAEKQWEGKNCVEFGLSKWMSCYQTDVSSITLIGRPSYSLALFDNTDNSESTKYLIDKLPKLFQHI
ncbi:cytochrome P450 [Gigaspora margarita]|uniref:Cytochrome P450 n=1 Tax=Gigaspora margarita TaxID=4874 RepID=A0A8H3XBU8_GIGMA|nr:cytochrome P450 [Gigaspora margarita]